MNIRTRFAPSPTGYLHIGAVRTAIFAWLLARQNNGTFILRIEDTDKNREVSDSEKHIIESLQWLGLNWDEGPDIGGQHAPYRQSERLEIYHKYAQQLVDKGLAYADTTTTEQLTKWREQAKSEKRPFHFNDHRPANPPDWELGMPLRLKIDSTQSPAWNDIVRGAQKSSHENLDDFILLKADGFPTYNFAHIIDDHEMGITHIIRGEEFVSSVPKYLKLYEALEFTPPVMAHMPNILAPTGNKKLSKRDGAPDLLQYRDQGYQPDAILNFLAKLGWNDGTEQEVYTRNELLEKFSLERVQKSPARFDEKQLLWISGHHIRETSLDDLYVQTESFWPAEAKNADSSFKKQVLALVQERLKCFSELAELTAFFFSEPKLSTEWLELDKRLKKLEPKEVCEWLAAAVENLSENSFDVEDIEAALRTTAENNNYHTGKFFMAVRVAVAGTSFSPPLFETMNLLGKETCLKRLEAGKDALEA